MAHLYVLRTARPAGSRILQMAIYHLSASIIGRSAGRSVTAAAAYRAATKIEDQTTGIVHNYDRKQGVDYSEILSPISANLESDWLTDREKLWNKVETIERRKDAQLAREITIAIPYELPREEKIALVREYVKNTYIAAGMVADVNLHHLEGNNPHAHILLTMRNLETMPDGGIEFGLKNTDWNSKKILLEQRKTWEEAANKYLASNGLDTKIDCRSLEEQGSPFIPQIHVGVHAMAMKNKGIPTDRSEEFDRIENANNDIREQLEKIYQLEYENHILEEPINEVFSEENIDNETEDNRLGALLYKALLLNNKEKIKIKPVDKETFLSLKQHEDHDYKTICYHASLTNRNTINLYVSGYQPRICEFKQENDAWVKDILYNKGMQPKPNYYLPNYHYQERLSKEELSKHVDNLVDGLDEKSIENYIKKEQYLVHKDLEDKHERRTPYRPWNPEEIYTISTKKVDNEILVTMSRYGDDDNYYELERTKVVEKSSEINKDKKPKNSEFNLVLEIEDEELTEETSANAVVENKPIDKFEELKKSHEEKLAKPKAKKNKKNQSRGKRRGISLS